MPAIAGLTPMEAVTFGWFGKHPAFGDFVARGVGDDLSRPLQDWLDGALGAWRQEAGPHWQDAFDSAPNVRFWIGAQVLGGGVSGVMVPSHDKVGRRYPLVVLVGGVHVPPPLEPEQVLHDALEAGVGQLRANPETGAEVVPAAPVEDLLWAMNESGATEGLLSDIAAEDMCRAAQTRSYWWVPGTGTQAARVISTTGLPEGGALTWLLSGSPVSQSEAGAQGEVSDDPEE